MLLLFFTLFKCSVLEFPKNYVHTVFVSSLNFIEEFIGEAKEVFMSQKKNKAFTSLKEGISILKIIFYNHEAAWCPSCLSFFLF